MDTEHEGTGIHKAPMENQDLSFLQQTVGEFFGEYGWYGLFLSVGLYLLIQHLNGRRTSQDRSSSSPAFKEDAAAVARKQEALEASRRRMQEELDANAAKFKEKQQKLDEEKRQQKIEMWESMKTGKSYKGNTKLAEATEEASTSAVLKPKTDKKPLRNSGFNPLTGEGGGACSWRPGRRGPSAGG